MAGDMYCCITLFSPLPLSLCVCSFIGEDAGKQFVKYSDRTKDDFVLLRSFLRPQKFVLRYEIFFQNLSLVRKKNSFFYRTEPINEKVHKFSRFAVDYISFHSTYLRAAKEKTERNNKRRKKES